MQRPTGEGSLVGADLPVGCIAEDVTERAELCRDAEQTGIAAANEESSKFDDAGRVGSIGIHARLRTTLFKALPPTSFSRNGPALNAPIKLRHFLGPTLRESDQLFGIHDHAAILMGETSREGAMAAIARYKEACEGEIDLRFAVASFPEDGSTVHELLAVAGQRLNKAVTLEPRAVVAEGRKESVREQKR